MQTVHVPTCTNLVFNGYMCMYMYIYMLKELHVSSVVRLNFELIMFLVCMYYTCTCTCISSASYVMLVQCMCH